mmetsp:Transcript_38012/g.108544  ORF Transcript_38012/g.108544 Transcript_38012/m.108544 type:complete len:96 (-) Transcript_38012:164-451(-)
MSVVCTACVALRGFETRSDPWRGGARDISTDIWKYSHPQHSVYTVVKKRRPTYTHMQPTNQPTIAIHRQPANGSYTTQRGADSLSIDRMQRMDGH